MERIKKRTQSLLAKMVETTGPYILAMCGRPRSGKGCFRGSANWSGAAMCSAFMQYLVDQHFLEAAAPIDDLFAPIVAWSE